MGCRNTQRYACEENPPAKTVQNLSDGINNEDKILYDLLKDFYTRLDTIKQLHVTYDKRVPSKKALSDDYFKDYGSTYIKKDEQIPEEVFLYDLESLKNIHAAIDNLIKNIPYLQSAVNSNRTGVYGTKYDKNLSTTMNNNNINFNQYIIKNQYNVISNNIRYLEEICAHNSDNAHNGYSPCSNSGSSEGDGGSTGNGYSPWYGTNGSCASHREADCSSFCGSYRDARNCPQQGKRDSGSWGSYGYNRA